MLHEHLHRLRALRRNIERYRRLLATHLTDFERAYVESRVKEEQTALEILLQKAFPDRLSVPLPTMERRTTDPEMGTLLHPAHAFAHPMDVIDDDDLTSYEKRAILSSWAADACAVNESGRPVQQAVTFDDIVDALNLLDGDEPAEPGKGSGRHPGRKSPDTLSFDS